MSDTTPRLGLPLIAAGQAEKEIFHNEALARIDAVALATVEEAGLSAPPADAGVGRCWIVGPAPTGAWAGQALALACLTEGGWRFVPPRAGMAVRRSDTGLELRFDGAGWRSGGGGRHARGYRGTKRGGRATAGDCRTRRRNDRRHPGTRGDFIAVGGTCGARPDRLVKKTSSMLKPKPHPRV